MNTTVPQQTATIHQFPLQRRGQAETRLAALRFAAEARAQPVYEGVGESWYHAAAIRDAELSTSS